MTDNKFHVEDKLWDSAKARYCKEHGIDIHIDDSTIYKKWFSTPYCLYDTFESSCRLEDGKKMDFSGSAEIALNEVENAVRKKQSAS